MSEPKPGEQYQAGTTRIIHKWEPASKIKYSWRECSAGIVCECGERLYIDPEEDCVCKCGRVYRMIDFSIKIQAG